MLVTSRSTSKQTDGEHYTDMVCKMILRKGKTWVATAMVQTSGSLLQAHTVIPYVYQWPNDQSNVPQQYFGRSVRYEADAYLSLPQQSMSRGPILRLGTKVLQEKILID